MGAVALAVLAFGQLAAEGPGWVWDGAEVHPGCIRELTTALSDRLPVVAAVDLEGCRRSGRYSSPAEVAGSFLRWRDPEQLGRGYFEYRYLGVLTSGVHVVRVRESGGGSGVFQDLLFLRTGEGEVLESGRRRVRHHLTLVGSESLGDRDQATIELSGAQVTIRRRRFRGSQGWGPEEAITRRFELHVLAPMEAP